MASARQDPRLTNHRSSYGGNSPRNNWNCVAPEAAPPKRYTDYRRASPNEKRERWPDNIRRDSESEAQGRQSPTSARRHSLNSTTPNLDQDRAQRPLPNRSNTVDGTSSENPVVAQTMPRMDPKTLSTIINEDIPKAPAKRPASTEPVTDPRKRTALSGKDGPVIGRTSSPSEIVVNSKAAGESSTGLPQRRQSPQSCLSREKKTEVIVSLLVEFAEKSVETALLHRRQNELREIAERAKAVDEKNRKTFKEHTALIEQGEETKHITQRKASNAMDKYISSIQPREQSAQRVANEILTLVELPTELDARLITVEKQCSQERTEHGPRPVDEASFQNGLESLFSTMTKMQEANKALWDRLEKQEQELRAVKDFSNVSDLSKAVTETARKVDVGLKNTRAEIAGVRNTIQQLTATKATKFELEARTEQVHNSVALEITSLTESRSKALDDLRSMIKDVDTARVKDFEQVAADIQKCQIDALEMRSDLTEHVQASEKRDEIVIEDVESLSARVREAITSTDELSKKFEIHVSRSANTLHEIEGRLQGNIQRVASKQADLAAPKPVTTSPTSAELSSLRGQFDGFEANLRAMEVIGQRNDHSVKMLNNRFNNLTTEQVTRAMVHQLTAMYPYAATAQAEFVRVREDRKDLDTLRKQHDSACSEIAKASESIEVLQKDYRQSDSKLSLMTESFKEARDALQSRVDSIDKHFAGYKEDQASSSRKITEQLDALQTDLARSRGSIASIESRADYEATGLRVVGSKSKSGFRTPIGPSRRNSSGSSQSIVGAATQGGDLRDTRPATSIPTVITGPGRNTSRTLQDNGLEYLEGWQANKTNASRQSVDGHSDDSDSPLATIGANGVKTPPPARTANGNITKRKRANWDPENNDRSDDETWGERKSPKLKSRSKKALRKT